ncbi:MAG TPA: PD-(D/E)XK nuclease family protein, partial [Abditibacterium sp.]
RPETHFETLIQLRSQRRDAEKVGIYDGVLGERGAHLMQRWAATQHSDALSSSALELFARCPLRYFFERVLGLDGEDQPDDDDLDARAAGTLVHEITRRFFETHTSPLQAENFDAARQILAEIAREECFKLPIRPILREAEWHRLMGADGQSGPLSRWLKLETAAGKGVWNMAMRPLSHSQISLEGVKNGLEHRFRIEISGQTVVGTIDRLDISAGGEQIAVLDYKTGGIAGLPSWNRGDSGLHFQLAIYALAARNLTQNQPNPPRLAMAYLSLRSAKIARGIGQDGTFKAKKGQQLSDENFADWLGDVSARVGQIAAMRRAGSFHIALQNAKDAKCEHCDCKTLCGQNVEVQRARFDGLQRAEKVYLPTVWEWT